MRTAGRNVFSTAKAIQGDISRELGPPEEGLVSETQVVVQRVLVRGTRGYIETVANQINGAYENGWYDACSVMLRRLIETLIIECFEEHDIDDKIKNPRGDFFFLGDLVDACLRETAWNLGRSCKQALPRLKDIGDKSAHSRRFTAKRGDIDPLLGDIRVTVQELLAIARLK